MLKTLHGFGHLGESLVAGLAVVLSICASGAAGAESAEPAFSVLVFSKTAGYRHDSISFGIAAVRALGEQNNFRVDASEDAAIFNDESLAQYRVMVFLNTTGDVLEPGHQAAFEKFVRRGRGFVGVHSAPAARARTTRSGSIRRKAGSCSGARTARLSVTPRSIATSASV